MITCNLRLAVDKSLTVEESSAVLASRKMNVNIYILHTGKCFKNIAYSIRVRGPDAFNYEILDNAVAMSLYRRNPCPCKRSDGYGRAVEINLIYVRVDCNR